MIRIIAGRAKGCRLIPVPSGSAARPTPDRVKEALFNILPSLEGDYFIDLFAGTGNIGLEAMSRGAGKVFFVENNAAMTVLIKKNIEKCGLTGEFEILPVPVERAVRNLQKRDTKMDIVFADPPYERGWIGKTINALKSGELFSDRALMILQHSMREPLPDEMGLFELADQRKYGDTIISILAIRL